MQTCKLKRPGCCMRYSDIPFLFQTLCVCIVFLLNSFWYPKSKIYWNVENKCSLYVWEICYEHHAEKANRLNCSVGTINELNLCILFVFLSTSLRVDILCMHAEQTYVESNHYTNAAFPLSRYHYRYLHAY